jgi:predicted transcriptional regulator of viral defense system
MKYQQLKKLKEKPFFTVEDLAEVLGIKRISARVLASRYVAAGYFVRPKNNFYVLAERWENFSREDFYKIANYLQVPSYISFMTALGYYEVTTQIQRGFFQSAALKRTEHFSAAGVAFNYNKLSRKLFFGFEKRNGIFIARKEKSFLDCVYLYSFGRYSLDVSSLNFKILEPAVLKKYLKFYPEKTKKAVKKICGI